MAVATPQSASVPPGTPGSSGGTTATASPSAAPPVPLSGSLRLTGTNCLPNVRTLAWIARGSTKVVGDVEVTTGDLAGSLAVGGKFIAVQLDLSGTHRIDGEVRVSGGFRVRGTLRAGASVSARNALLVGSTAIGGDLTVAETLQWKGSLDVNQNVDAATVLFDGRLAVKGTLTARSISGQLGGLSSAEELHADWIDIRPRKSLLPSSIFFLPPPPWHELEVQQIEAREVHLSGIRVLRLKADRIWLGPDTHVQYFEGTIVHRHKDAHVGPESESSPPPGLSR